MNMDYILLTGSSGAIGKEIKRILKEGRWGENIIELDLLGNPSVDATNEKAVKDFFEIHKNKKITKIINCVGIPDAIPLKAETILVEMYSIYLIFPNQLTLL